MSEQKPYSKAIILLLKKTVEKGSPVWDHQLSGGDTRLSGGYRTRVDFEEG